MTLGPWTTFNSPAESRAWGRENADTLRSLFSQATDGRVRRAFGQITSTESVVCTDVEEVQQATGTCGRVALLGDAAHALTPNMGQGAGMAMEDAVVLAKELATASRSETDVSAALPSYEARRRGRIETIARLSRQIGEDGQLTGTVECWLRSRRMRRDGRAPERGLAMLERLLAWPPPGEERAGWAIAKEKS